MSNTLYPKGAEKLLTGSINLLADTIKATLLPDSYVYSTAHEFVSQLGPRVGTDQALTGKEVVNGTFDADNADFGALPPGNIVKAIAFYKDTGNPSTSPVFQYLDTGQGYPFHTNGGGVTAPWNNDVRRILRVGAPFYPKGADRLLTGGFNVLTDTLKVALLPSTYVRDDAHEYLIDVGPRIGVDQTLEGKVIVNGALDADDPDFGPIATGSTIGTAVIYRDTGDEASSPLLMSLPNVIGFPMPTNGAAISLLWPDGSVRIVSLIPA